MYFYLGFLNGGRSVTGKLPASRLNCEFYDPSEIMLVGIATVPTLKDAISRFFLKASHPWQLPQ